MKKILAMLLCLSLLLTACGKTETGNTGEKESESASASQESSTEESTGKEETDTQTQIANPMVEYDSAVFPGLELTGYPNDEELSPEHYWLIDNTLIQLDYTVELQELTFRAQAVENEDISGVYDSFEEDVTQDMTLEDGTVISVRSRATAGGAALSTWSRDGWSYSLYMPHSPMGMQGGLLPRFLEAVGLTTVVTAQ